MPNFRIRPAVIGLGAQSTLGGTKFLPEKICIKISKMPEFSCQKNYQNTRIFMIFARKIYKIPEFYMIFARKNARILRNNCPENIFPEF